MVRNKPGRWLLTSGLGILSMLLGAFFCIETDHIAEQIHLYAGAALMLNGVIFSFLFFWRKEYYNAKSRTLQIGLLLIAAATVILCTPHDSKLVICIIWGIFSIVKAVLEIDHLVKERSMEMRVWVQAAFSLTELILGIILLLELTHGISHHVLFLGVSWIVDGIERQLEYWDDIDI